MKLKEEEEEEEDEDDENLSQFLFDAFEPTRINTLEFIPTSSFTCVKETHHPQQDSTTTTAWFHTNEDKDHILAYPPMVPISAVIQAIDDYPGAKQSGLYLWPAGPALAQYLVDSMYGITLGSISTTTADAQQRIQSFWSSILFGSSLLPMDHQQQQKQSRSIFHIVELGSGCGIAGIVANEIFTYALSCTLKKNHDETKTTIPIVTLTFTDHDPNTLTRAQTNTKLSFENMTMKQTSLEKNSIDSSSYISILNQTQILYQSFKWGDLNAITIWKKSIQSIGTIIDQEEIQEHYQLVLGSDLIYSIHVVRPLFQTAVQFLQAWTTTHSRCFDHTISRNRKDQGIFILTQSFIYDDEIELEIDSICKELGLSRCTLWDDLMKESKTTPSTTNKNNYYSAIRIQVYFLST